MEARNDGVAGSEALGLESKMGIPLFGPYGSGALKYADRLVGYGVNAAWFHGFDPSAFETCERHGLAACTEFKTFRANFEERPELRPIGVDGKPIRYGRLVQGVCLSQREFLNETEEALLAGVRAYQPAGIWLDYLTYGGWFETPDPDLQESCFCADCVAAFNRSTGIDAAEPAAILERYQAEWTRFKCERIAGYAARYAEIVRAHLPGCVVGAYMCPWRPDEYDGALTRIFAQDYDLLAPAIDVFTPLIYCQKSGRPADWGRAFLEGAPRFVPPGHPVQLILDALDYPESLLAVAASERPSWGIQVFGGMDVFGDPERAQVFASSVERMRRKIDQGRRTMDEG
jgi:hypothetical protein